jgi:hypothetical protein
MAAYPQHNGEGLDGVDEDRVSQKPLSISAELQTTANAILAHVWYADRSGALVFVNSRIADYRGLPKDHPFRLGIDGDGKWESHIRFLHPNDLEETRRVWRERGRMRSWLPVHLSSLWPALGPTLSPA